MAGSDTIVIVGMSLAGLRAAETLRRLQIEEHPFQFRFAKHVTSSFDLPNPNYSL